MEQRVWLADWSVAPCKKVRLCWALGVVGACLPELYVFEGVFFTAIFISRHKQDFFFSKAQHEHMVVIDR